MATKAPAIDLHRLAAFSGGLNIRDTGSQLGATEMALAHNVMLDERGGVSSRLGYSEFNSSSYGAAPPQNLFFWSNFGGQMITQVGASVYQGTSTTPIKTFTTSALCGICEFQDFLYLIHPIDGLYKWDGATATLIAGGPKGFTISPWQNKLWAAGDPNLRMRLYFCDPGDPATWTDYVDIRDTDDTAITCVAGGQGVDIVSRAGLVVLKAHATHRIYDSATGAYQTIDTRRGVPSPNAVAFADNMLYAVNEYGVFKTDGVAPLKSVSDQLRPLFTNEGLSITNVNKMCAVGFNNHVYISLTKNGSSYNDLMLDFDVATGAVTTNSNAASDYAVDYYLNRLISGSPSVNGKNYIQLSGGTDNGTAIDSYMQTRWIELNAGMMGRINRLRVNGRGSFTLKPLYNYNTTQTISRSISLSSGSSTIHGGYQDVYDLGVGNAFAFHLSASTSTTGSIPGLTGARTVGAWGVYSLDLNQIAALGMA